MLLLTLGNKTMQPFFDIDAKGVGRLKSELRANAIYQQAGKSEDGSKTKMPTLFLDDLAQISRGRNRKYQPERTAIEL